MAETRRQPLSKRNARALARQQAAIEAAYVEGYLQGTAHPKGEQVIPKATMLAHLWWRTVELRLFGMIPPEGAP